MPEWMLTNEPEIRRQVHNLIIDYNEKRKAIEGQNLSDMLDKMARGENIQNTIKSLIAVVAQAQAKKIKDYLTEEVESKDAFQGSRGDIRFAGINLDRWETFQREASDGGI